MELLIIRVQSKHAHTHIWNVYLVNFRRGEQDGPTIFVKFDQAIQNVITQASSKNSKHDREMEKWMWLFPVKSKCNWQNWKRLKDTRSNVWWHRIRWVSAKNCQESGHLQKPSQQGKEKENQKEACKQDVDRQIQ